MQIRPQFVRDYYLKRSAQRKKQSELNRTSEEEIKNLNAQWGEADKSSMLADQAQEYYPQYNELRARQRQTWEDLNLKFDHWYQASDVTISEFLFLDNLGLALDLPDLIERPNFNQMWHSEFLRAKAGAYIDRWKSEHNLKGVRFMVDHEISMIRYAEKRCRKHFSIRFWNLEQVREMRYYRNDYAKALTDKFDRLQF